MNDLTLPNQEHFTLSATSFEMKDGVSYDDWKQCGDFLKRAEGAVQFWIGDWLNAGEKNYGETYAQAVDPAQANTWKNYKWTASNVEKSRRRDNLSFGHHYSVAALEPKEQKRWLDAAESAEWTRAELRNALKRVSAPELPSGKFQVIYADPPWKYGQDQHGKEEQETVLGSHYASMATEDICALPIGDLAADKAVLFLWTTSPKLFEAKEVIDAWGFEYKASVIWDKIKHNVGYYVSVRHEFLLICTRGSCLPDDPKLHDSVVSVERTAHSEKPDYFYELIERMYHGKKIELFARRARDGWTSWGDQL